MCNAERIELLKAARRAIDAHSETYICHALQNKSGPRPERKALSDDLRQEVEGHLHKDDCSTYAGWLCLTIVGETQNPDFCSTDEQDREGRLLWLDQMIAAAEKGEPVPPPPIPSSLQGLLP